MTDLNPYESPKVREPKRAAKVVKQTIGVTAVILLTPVALAIAFAASCGATFISVDMLGPSYDLMLFGGLAIFLLPPAVTLAAMIWWARREYLAERNPSKEEMREGREDLSQQ